MDAVIVEAARALTKGDPLGALNRVALRDDPKALALRGTAMAMLGDFARARTLLRSAARSFGPVERARCQVAEAEIALASRDLGFNLEAARATLEKAGDQVNAAYAHSIEIRQLVLIGRIGEAERQLSLLDPCPFPPALRAIHELVIAGIAIRRLHTDRARNAFERAAEAARGIGPLMAEVETAARLLEMPAARLVTKDEDRLLRLDEVEVLLASGAIIIDACRLVVRDAGTIVPLAGRPVLFALARILAESWPADATRAALIARAFRGKEADESHRARLRVEIGRLRAALKPLAELRATRHGFALVPNRNCAIKVLARPVEDEHAPVLAFLADGESWSSSALALALGASQRTVQRALEALQASGKVQAFGDGRARRWMTPPLPGLTTSLLLPILPSGA